MGANMGKNCCGSATRPLLIYLAGVLFPEGAVAGSPPKLDRLKKAGSITDTEFARLRAKLVQ
jgi:hypothetical protein